MTRNHVGTSDRKRVGASDGAAIRGVAAGRHRSIDWVVEFRVYGAGKGVQYVSLRVFGFFVCKSSEAVYVGLDMYVVFQFWDLRWGLTQWGRRFEGPRMYSRLQAFALGLETLNPKPLKHKSGQDNGPILIKGYDSTYFSGHPGRPQKEIFLRAQDSQTVPPKP